MNHFKVVLYHDFLNLVKSLDSLLNMIMLAQISDMKRHTVS
jgi:hypothetical protein